MFRTALNKYDFCKQHKTIPDKKAKNSITAPNKSVNIYEQYMSCNMSYYSIDENNNSVTAPFQNNRAVRASEAQYDHAFSEQHFYKMNSYNNTNHYLIKK
jgi:hypothetical protein